MEKRNFTQKQKIAILEGAKRTTIRYAAEVAGIHYTTVCFVFQKREKNLRFFDVTYSPPTPV